MALLSQLPLRHGQRPDLAVQRAVVAAVAALAVLGGMGSCAGRARPAAAASSTATAAAPPAGPQSAAAARGAQGAQGAIEQWREAYEVRSLDALAKLYAHEAGLVVAQDGTLQLGWTAVEASLRTRLARASAIHVRLRDLQVTALGPDAASAVAAMTRESTNASTTATENGIVTLVLRRDDAGWVIVAEHYSYKRP